MWQEVEKLESFIAFIPTVEMMFRPFDIGNPAVGVAVEVRAHVSKDNVWHLWLGICPSGYDAPLVKSPGGLRLSDGATASCVSRSMSLGHSTERLLFYRSSGRGSLYVGITGSLI